MPPTNQGNHDEDYLLPEHQRARSVQPLNQNNSSNDATELIRKKLDSLYAQEPNAKEELNEVLGEARPRSKHQAYMQQLSQSGMSLADIQTAWHNYYQHLSDAEKHEVWQEFYAEHGQHYQFQPQSETSRSTSPLTVKPAPPKSTKKRTYHRPKPPVDTRTVAEVKQQLTNRVSQRRKLTTKQHFQSLMFGVGMGTLVLIILLFGFFNERFIAPFITPSRQVSSTPIIIDPSTTAVGPNPEVIIPKINVEIPVVYNEPSVDEEAIQTALERGVVHYATTPNPGEKGNAVIFGHSSNNILNPGKYKFAFVLLSRLENGDTFYLTKDGIRYAYQVYDKRIVKPTDVSVLGTTDKPATATLITCDPPGTSLNRLIVVGQQISPDPSTDKASTAIKSAQTPTIIPSNAPSLWQRLTHTLHL